MVRRGSSLAVLLGVFLVAASLVACSDGDDGDDPAEDAAADTTAVTVPADADPGIGYLVLDGEPHLLTVRSCSLEPVTDPATGITTEVSVDADDGVTMNVAITRRVVAGDVPTTTDNISVAEDGTVVAESQRIDIAGNYQDLRAPGVLEPLIVVDEGLVTARGVFGPVGSVDGDAGLVEGSLTLRCL